MKTTRRGFFGALAGLAGSAYAAFVPKAKAAGKPVKLLPGQIWEDRDKAWSCDSCEFTYLLLSCDRNYREPADPNRYWKIAVFQHAGNGSGFFGAYMRYFTEEEVRKMCYTGIFFEA